MILTADDLLTPPPRNGHPPATADEEAPFETISAARFGARFGLSERAVKKGIAEGVLPGQKIGDRYLIPIPAVLAWADELGRETARRALNAIGNAGSETR